jgi:hypothetical protein
MSERDHDDGLVHNHGWARNQPAPHQTVSLVNRPEPAGHDDGLVHDHGWACTERSRMAQRG